MSTYRLCVLCIYLFSFCLYVSTELIILRILYCIFVRNKSLGSELSFQLKVNLICWALMLGTGIPHIGYMIFQWRPEDSENSTHWIFWSQLFTQCCIPVITFSVLFLTMDRLLSVYFPMEYRNNFSAKTILQRVSVVFLMICYGIVLATFLAELPLPEFTSCITFACIIQKTGSKGFIISKIIGGCLIIVAGLVLLIKIQKQKRLIIINSQSVAPNIQSNIASHKANKVACLMLCTELLLNFVPQVIALVLYQSTGFLLANYVGPHNLFLSSLDAFISALTFQWIFKKRLQVEQQNHETTPVHHLTHHTSGHPPHPSAAATNSASCTTAAQQLTAAVRTSTLLVDHSINM